ncbi:MAG: sodium-dependent bicarbonate transport family permease [Rhodanobacteraceae bacterium]|nr:sodium-dependent bicarbonate transport family permease [Rhodanobacteraceae bacterium]
MDASPPAGASGGHQFVGRFFPCRGPRPGPPGRPVPSGPRPGPPVPARAGGGAGGTRRRRARGVCARLARAIAFVIRARWAPDAAATAAHYGSVSVATFAVGVNWLLARDIAFEPQATVFLAVMEVPAIMVGIVLARGIGRDTNWGVLLHETFLGKGVTLLLGGMAIGWIAGPEGLAPIKGLFYDLFKGVLALFLLEMGLIVSHHIGELRRNGLFLLAFGLLMPLLSGMLGLGCGMLLGLSVGGLTLLATLAASASYIAVPAAMRVAVPHANPALSLGVALGVTFPFNILVGIPLYHRIAVQLVGATP